MSTKTTAVRATLPADAARQMIDSALAESTSMSTPMTAVVVDESGVVKSMLRTDGAPLVSLQTAIDKAYAAAAIGIPPDDFYEAIPGQRLLPRDGKVRLRFRHPDRRRV